MNKKGKVQVVFHHGDFPEGVRGHKYFGPKGTVHQFLEKRSGQHLCWSFKGGFIHKHYKSFWKTISKTDILFTRSSNMDYADLSMHWNHAEESMLTVLTQIKKVNPDIKIFFFEDNNPENSDKFSEFGAFITDLHGDEELLNYFESI